MGVRKDVRELMAEADPAMDQVVDEERARRDLEAILLGETAAEARRGWLQARGRLALTLAAGLTAAAVAVVIVVLPGSEGGRSTYAATPASLRYVAVSTESSAPELLEQIADHAAGLPESSSEVSEITSRAWSLSTQVSSSSTDSEIIAAQWRTVLHSDGTRTATHTTPEGSETFEDGPDAYSQPAPADEAEFSAWLEAAYGQPLNDPLYLQAAVHDLITQQVLGPDQRAALLRLIAATPGLEYDGRVTDRTGRDGEAFSAISSQSGLPTRYTFIIDPNTGDLLGQEDTLTETAGALNVPIPSVISYEVYLLP